MLGFIIGCAVYGVLSLVFAIVRPPSFVGGFFPVPRILTILPDAWVMPVGRGLMGVGFLIMAGWMFVKVR